MKSLRLFLFQTTEVLGPSIVKEVAVLMGKGSEGIRNKPNPCHKLETHYFKIFC